VIHSTAYVEDGAQIPDDVDIGPFTLVHANVQIGPGTRIGSHCSIGEPTKLANGRPLVIGEGAEIRSHTVIYEGSAFGPRLETGHHVSLREGLEVGENLRVGTLSDLQGDATIGNFVRLHSNVFIAQQSTIEHFVWIFPHTVLTNDPHPPSDLCTVGPVIEEFASIAANCCIAPGVRIGARSLVAASSMVTRDVEPDTVVRGVPARPVGPTRGVLLRDGSARSAYPWTNHFRRGYPSNVTDSWHELT
jgi:acetyltransferase-like isoleucine patch superfamily enzyme